MVNRNTRDVKKLVYGKLAGSSALVTALGSVSKIKQDNPKNKSEYPCITYNIQGGLDEPYNPDRATGIVADVLRIDIFSPTVSSEQADSISDLIYELLHGQTIYNASLDVRVFSCYRESYGGFYEPEIGVWHLWHKYKFVNTAGNGA